MKTVQVHLIIWTTLVLKTWRDLVAVGTSENKIQQNDDVIRIAVYMEMWEVTLTFLTFWPPQNWFLIPDSDRLISDKTE